MANSAFLVVGLVANFLGFLNFDPNKLSPPPVVTTPEGLVRVVSGYAQNQWLDPKTGAASVPQPFPGNADPGGNIGNIVAYNLNGEVISLPSRKFGISAGGTKDVRIETNGGQDMKYVEIAAGDNGICLSWFSTTWPNGQQYVFTGDWFYICDVKDKFGSKWNEWYYGNRPAGHYQNDPNSIWYPYCGWLDNNHDCGHQIGVIIVEVDYVQNAATNPEETCNHHIWWGIDSNHWINSDNMPSTKSGGPNVGVGQINTKIPDSGPGSKGCTKKRSTSTSLVRSDIWSHNATDLCQSSNSRGPDFVSLAEGMHCDMDTRKLTPLCHGTGSYSNSKDKHLTKDCFSVEEDKLVGRSGLGKRQASKKYTEIQEWRQDESGP